MIVPLFFEDNHRLWTFRPFRALSLDNFIDCFQLLYRLDSQKA